MNKILVIGAGPILVGQACEFDYSGTQACKSLKEEKYKVILFNSNPATIMTDLEIADEIYIENINFNNLKKILIKENPDFILPTMGGQTSLNCILDLLNSNFIYNERNILGINKKTIINAENRKIFSKFIKSIGFKTPETIILNKNKKFNILNIFFPCIIRQSFTLGGLGSGIAYNKIDFIKIIKNSFNFSNEISIDRSIIGWKEYELELLIDIYCNIIVVCCIENIDPVGIHTGDSITITPPQTLSDKEFQNIRNISFKILKSIGLRGGGANVQFAINPINGDVIIIEMNPRVSRSAALASKATGYPIAKISAKLALGINILKLFNDITRGNLPASFEPSIDYVVIKFPKFNFEKFQNYDKLDTVMKSIGETMSIGCSFQDSFIKGIYSLLEIEKIPTFIKNKNYFSYKKKIFKNIINPNSKRIFFILDAFRLKFSIKFLFLLSKIDPWFLFNIKDIINYEIIYFKKHKKNFLNFNKIDSCSNEFICPTSYLYLSKNYNSELRNIYKKKIIIIGSCANRIGQSIEFDYCCVKASKFIKKIGFSSIIINCNPETVSTDYEYSSQLIFNNISIEFIKKILIIFKPYILISNLSGQTPINIIKNNNSENNIFNLQKNIIKICGEKKIFNKLLKKLKLNTFDKYNAGSINEIIFYTNILKKPIILRPSYVIGGANMQILSNNDNIINYLKNVFSIKIFIEKIFINSKELDIDLLLIDGKVLIFFLIEHVEYAGIHSGDSTMFFPTYSISKKKNKKIKIMVFLLCFKLKLFGIINFQICLNKKIFIIECNTRASRTIPFISKSNKFPFIYNYISLLIGYNIFFKSKTSNFYFLKESVLPVNKFKVINLSPEMKSTGEIMSIGLTIQECYKKSQNVLKKLFFYMKKIFFSLKYLKNFFYIYCNSFNKKIFFDLHINSYVSIIKKKKTIISNLFKKIHNNVSYTTLPTIKFVLSSFNKKYSIIRKINLL